MLCPYAREVGSKPSKIIDFADDYMFKIRGFDDDNVYEIWPKKPFYDIEPRTPRREKFYWLTHLKQACAEMEGALEGRSQQESLTNAEAVFAFEKDYFRHPLKPGTEKDEIDDQFERFKGTIEVSVYGTKKSGSGFRLSHDKRLLEVVVETLAGQTYAILRYRDDDTSPIIKGFIDLGTDAEKGGGGLDGESGGLGSNKREYTAAAQEAGSRFKRRERKVHQRNKRKVDADNAR